MTTSTSQLQVHVIGAGKGESVVLGLPDGQWGVVDCYATSLNDDKSNYTLEFLRQKSVSELAFVCLTHPHDDHFRGMSQILTAMRVKSIWRFSGMDGKYLKWLVLQNRREAKALKDTESDENATELNKIFLRVVELTSRAQKEPSVLINVSANKHLFPIPPRQDADFTIIGIGPTDGRIQAYESLLQRSFDEKGALRARLPNSDHNMVSSALLIRYGKTRVILGGDLDSPGWRESLKHCGEQSLYAHLVKISHHGSANGFAEEAWQAFAKSGKVHAVLAPYRRFRLPKGEVIDVIRQFADEIVSTSSLNASPVEEKPASSLTSRLALRATLNITSDSGDGAPGRCSFYFDDSGNCQRELAGAATIL